MRIECINGDHKENNNESLETENYDGLEVPSDFRDIHENGQFNSTRSQMKYGCFSFRVAHDEQKGR